VSGADAVAVVTVSFNSGDALRSFLATIDASGAHADVVVVDNASPDPGDLVEVVAAHSARLLQLPENVGYGGAVNAAIAALPSSIDYVLVSNPDVTLSPGSLDELVAAATRRRDAGTLGPRILDAEGATYPSARRLPSLRTGIGHALFGTVWPTNPWTRSYRQDRLDVNERDAGWLSGACVLVRRSAFDQVGGFDASYFMYFEDVDLGARMTRAGWANVYVPSAVVTHTGAHSTSRFRSRMEHAHHMSAYTYLARKYPNWYLAPLRLALRVGIGLRERIVAGGRRR